MVSTIVGGPVKIAFKVLARVLGAFDLDILSVTAAIGDAIVGFDKWLTSTFNFSKVFDKIMYVLSNIPYWKYTNSPTYFPNYQNKNDLFQVGCIGLIKAKEKFKEQYRLSDTNGIVVSIDTAYIQDTLNEILRTLQSKGV